MVSNLNPVLSNTNEGTDGICSKSADTWLIDFFRQEERNKEVDKGEGESDETSVNGDGSRMEEEDDNDTLENGEQALEYSVRTKVVTRPHEKRTPSRSQLQASGFQELARVNAKRLKVENQDRQQLLEFRREEAEKTRKYKKELMAELYLKMIMVQQSNKFRINFSQQSQMYNVRFSQNVQPPPSSLPTYMSPPMSPVYGIPCSVPRSVYPTNNVTSTPLRPGDDLNLS